ncbi:MAG: hypothetical protein C0392_10430 [Syntrophus sp. (in: bacteria)]|nr:hypothetical protein [Syntrophus sp. (in: bacteria)]
MESDLFLRDLAQFFWKVDYRMIPLTELTRVYLGSEGQGIDLIICIIFEGHDITKVEAHRIVSQGISLVPEGRRLFPNLSVYKNLLLGAYLTNDGAEIAQRLDYVYTIFPILKERTAQEALDICDRAYVIQTGRVVLNGTGKELLSSELIQKAFLGL